MTYSKAKTNEVMQQMIKKDNENEKIINSKTQ